ncbi:hypothetical protein C8F04DRAFT_1189636 [Mycena alexandri]|uniref:Uncharacterized protein n=1 Tax=Mycena alexandri TaxID=1745969 RepID=A0AAD6SGR7_9AGAR|nr:hypothetical protein C8F04DRAFT_1189636 [Mycena alexandri]
MAFRFTSVPTKYTARPLLAPPLPVTLPTLLTSLTPQQFPAPRLLTNIESTRATTPAPPSPPPRAPPTPPPRAPTPRAPSPRAPSRASTPAHQHRSSVSRESSLSSLESEDDSADSPGTASGSTKILRPAGAKIQTVKELFVDRFPELDQEQRNAKYNDFRSRIDHLCGLYLRPTVALAYQAKEDADKVYNKMATTFPWLTSYHNYWPVAVCLQGKLHNSAARAVEKSNKKAVDIIQSVAPARSGSKGARKIESREPEGTLLFTECGHRGSRLRWGNFPDPRTGIKTRKWFNTGLTRLLGRHITLIIAIHPPGLAHCFDPGAKRAMADPPPSSRPQSTSSTSTFTASRSKLSRAMSRIPIMLLSGGIFIIIATNIPVRGQFGLKIIKTPSTLTWNGERKSELHRVLSQPPNTHAYNGLHLSLAFGKRDKLFDHSRPN